MKKWLMLKSLPIREISALEALFFASIVLGPSAAYSKVYLFHVVLAALIFGSASAWTIIKLHAPSPLRWDALFFVFFITWYGISIFWAQNKFLALQYCTYIVVGALTIYFTVTICRTLDRLRAALWIIVGMISLELMLAALEAAQLIRLPFSPYSPYRWIFGREPNSFNGLSQIQIDQILSMPTGFSANPNNISALLVLAFPVFLFAKRWWLAALGAAAIYYVIEAADARAAIIGYWAVLVLGAFFFVGYRLRILAIATLTALMMVLMGSGPFAFLAATRYSEGLISGQANGGDSVGIRTQLIINGLTALRETYGLGVGAGGSVTVQEVAGDKRIRNIRSMHNFWVELLVDGGILFATIFSVWSGSLIWRLWQIGRSRSKTTLRYLGRALCLGFLGFFFSAIGPSSVIYLLPMWMFIGLALAVIQLDSEGHSISVSATTAPSLLGNPH